MTYQKDARNSDYATDIDLIAREIAAGETTRKSLSTYESNLFKMKTHSKLEIIQKGLALSSFDAKEKNQLNSRIDELKSTLPLSPQENTGMVSRVFRILLMNLIFIPFVFPFAILIVLLSMFDFILAPLLPKRFIPSNMAQQGVGQLLMLAFGAEVYIADEDKITESAIYLYNHTSNYDGVAIAYTKLSAMGVKYLYKKSLTYIPMFGLMARVMRHYPIDRKNRTSAIKSLNAAGDDMLKFSRSVAIAPEGTRTEFGHLGSFKKGAFHLANHVKLPIVPVIIYGAYEIWPRQWMFPKPGKVLVRFLPAVDVAEEDTVDSLIEKVRTKMLLAMQDDPPSGSKHGISEVTAVFTGLMVVFYAACLAWMMA